MNMNKNYRAGIYKLTSPSGKCYIGQSIELNTRLKKYEYGHCKSQNYIYNALKKYGFENFKIDILFETSDPTNIYDVLNQLELDFINLYGCIAPKGYNLRTGGDSYKLSQITKDKIAESSIGKVMSKEARLSMSKAKLGVSRKPFTEETIKKMSKPKTAEHSRNIAKSKHKIVYQYDMNNQLVKQWNSVKETKAEGFHPSAISSVCSGRRKSTGGFKWSYELWD